MLPPKPEAAEPKPEGLDEYEIAALVAQEMRELNPLLYG